MKDIDAFEFLRQCDKEHKDGDGSIADWAARYYMLEAESLSESIIKTFDSFDSALTSYKKWKSVEERW